MPADLSGSRWAHNSASKPIRHLSPTSSSFTRPRSPQFRQTSPTCQSQSVSTGTDTNTSAQPARTLSKPEKDLLSRHSDFVRFTKLLRRLKWKSQTLLYCYHRVLDPQSRAQNVIGGVVFPMHTTAHDDSGEGNEAEMMFKIDFFEFYVLLERVLVHLLGVVGTIISAAYGDVKEGKGDGLRGAAPSLPSPSNPNSNVPKGASNTSESQSTPIMSLREELLHRHALIGDSKNFHWQGQHHRHRFHANVLSALDYPDNPLHSFLGTGVVRDYLGIAKEFRNRWKDAEEKIADKHEDGLVGSRYEKMLTDLRLDNMLACIVVAVEKGGEVGKKELGEFEGVVWEEVRRRGDGGQGGIGGMREVIMMELDEVEKNDAPWEAMPDAMEWD